MPSILIWSTFIVVVLLLLALDLGVFHRRPHEIGVMEALGWSSFWILLALAFNVVVYWLYENNWVGVGLAFSTDVDGRTAALEFLTGYLLEKSLSLDNIFVIALIFTYFQVPLAFQHRVLFWGIVGALVFRGVMIAAGAALLGAFAWMTYVFGGALLLTAARMLVASQESVDPDRNLFVRTARRIYPVAPVYDGTHFFTEWKGARAATPLLLVLLMVESTDVLFAVDSIPAIFAVTSDPFLVYTSNVFAILGLRSLYFALAPLLPKFRYLKISLVFVLAYIGVKMILTHHYHIPPAASLAVILGILTVGILASVVQGTEGNGHFRSPIPETLSRFATATVSSAWRSVILVVGGTVLVIGAAMIFLPGPATLVIPLGLAILATQVVWAWRLLREVRGDMERAVRAAGSGADEPPGKAHPRGRDAEEVPERVGGEGPR